MDPISHTVSRQADRASKAAHASAEQTSGMFGSEYQLDYLQPRNKRHDQIEEMSNADFHSATPLCSTVKSKSAHRTSHDDKGTSHTIKPSISGLMFAGPPPPVHDAAMQNSFRLLSGGGGDEGGKLSEGSGSPPGSSKILRYSIDSGIQTQFVPSLHENTGPPVLQGLHKRYEALQREFQTLLDLQAAALASGSKRPDDTDASSDAGSDAPTETFYSTATSRSQLRRSLYATARSTVSGEIIPVRQPRPRHLGGLRIARSRLHDAMLSLADLGWEEQEYIANALQQRRNTLDRLAHITMKRSRLVSELEAIELDDNEPLLNELASLKSQYTAVDEEISRLEERLSTLRSQRRRLSEKIDSTSSRREAGLSAYRGALRQVDLELGSLLKNPPFEQLDTNRVRGDVFHPTKHVRGHGREFFRLIPERRTPTIAESCWQEEVNMLATRQSELAVEQEALEEGAAVWEHVTSLIFAFESELRGLVRPISTDTATAPSILEGSSPTKAVLSDEQMQDMLSIVAELQKSVQQAEQRGWNLLICAIGAELEAFQQALDVLGDLRPSPEQAKDQNVAIELNESSNTDSSTVCFQAGGVNDRGFTPATGDDATNLVRVLGHTGDKSSSEDGQVLLDIEPEDGLIRESPP